MRQEKNFTETQLAQYHQCNSLMFILRGKTHLRRHIDKSSTKGTRSLTKRPSVMSTYEPTVPPDTLPAEVSSRVKEHLGHAESRSILGIVSARWCATLWSLTHKSKDAGRAWNPWMGKLWRCSGGVSLLKSPATTTLLVRDACTVPYRNKRWCCLGRRLQFGGGLMVMVRAMAGEFSSTEDLVNK
jgi:hypothetical protein